MNTNSLFELADVLEKVAEYIDELENENATLEKSASESSGNDTKPYKNEVHEKLASIGFTPEEIEAMDSMPEATIQKIASAADQPWSLGQGTGPKREKTDAFLEFLVS